MDAIYHNRIQHHSPTDEKAWYPYTCAHCGTKVSGIRVSGYYTGSRDVRWLLCPNCGDGSVRTNNGRVYPPAKFGPQIEGLPKEIADAYEEARDCMSVNAFIACELLCRTILMHVGVEKGAKEKEAFEYYISYFEDKHLITANMKPWVDLIRRHGGKAAHTIEKPDRTRSESTLMFTAELLRIMYEMEYMSKKYTDEPKESTEKL